MLPPLNMTAELQSALLLLLPTFLWVMLFVRNQYSVIQYSGSLLGFIFQFQASLVFNIVLLDFGYCTFTSTDIPLFYGVPIDFILGQALLTPVIYLLLRKLPIWVSLIVALLLQVGIYDFASMVVIHSPFTQLTVLTVIPSLLLATYTAQDSHIYLRATLQAICWACFLTWFFPSLIFQNTHHSWDVFLNRPLWQNMLYLIPLIVPTVILISALWQFAVEGRGTAFPYDPPKKLVTGGIYGYISNPMQLGICLLVAWEGVMLESVLLSFSAIVAVLLFIVFKDICNGSCRIAQLDHNWERYQSAVPKWLPRSKPWKS